MNGWKFVAVLYLSLLVLVGLGHCQTERFYAIQKYERPQAVSSGVSSLTSVRVEFLSTPTLSPESQTSCGNIPPLACEQSRAIPTYWSKSREEKDGEALGGRQESRESLWLVQSPVHKIQSTRSRPLSQNRAMEEYPTQSVQYCTWTPERLARTLHPRGEVPKEVEAFVQAIAKTEGYCRVGVIPNRLHNPGDIMTTRTHAYPGQVGVYHHYAVFRSDKWGWLALETQIQKVIDGTSMRYHSSMTMMEIARVYAENYRYWGRTVCKILRIDPRLTFDEYFGLAPKVRMTYDVPMWMRGGGDAMQTVLPMLAVSPQIHREAGWFLVEALS